MIILRSIVYRNTSKILNVLTEDSERISLVAKGARRTKSKFGGNLEPLNVSESVYYIKPEKEIGTLKEASIENSFQNIKSDLHLLNIAWGILWTVNRIPTPQKGLYGLTRRSLIFLDRGFGEEVWLYFMISMFRLGGVPPSLNRCVVCGSGSPGYFDISGGGCVCKKCRTSAIPFSEEELDIMRKLRKGRLSDWEKINDKSKEKIISVVSRYGIYHLGDWLKRLNSILPFDIIP